LLSLSLFARNLVSGRFQILSFAQTAEDREGWDAAWFDEGVRWAATKGGRDMQRKIGPRAVCGQTHLPWSGVASAAEAEAAAAGYRIEDGRRKDGGRGRIIV
jgi:hypothetical protein